MNNTKLKTIVTNISHMYGQKLRTLATYTAVAIALYFIGFFALAVYLVTGVTGLIVTSLLCVAVIFTLRPRQTIVYLEKIQIALR